jgi:hypothetical protein
VPSHRTIAAGLSVATLIGVSTLALPATGSHRPSVSLTIPHSLDLATGNRFRLSYTSSGLPSGSALALQFNLGPKYGWTRIEQLPDTRGQVVSPPAPEGKRRYRVVAVARGRVVASSVPRTIYVYGSTPYAFVCANAKITHVGCVTRDTWEYVGSTVFHFAAIRVAPGRPVYSTVVAARHSTCRAVTLRFAGATTSPPYTVYVRVTRPGHPPQVSSAPSQTVGSLHANLGGGPWTIQVAAAPGVSPVMVNGNFNCYTLFGT